MLYNKFKKLIQRTGFGVYDDSEYTQVSPLVCDNDVVQITIDGLGPVTERRFLPHGKDLWENNEIKPIKLGDAYMARLDFTATVDANQSYARIELDIGEESPNLILVDTLQFPKGAGIEHMFAVPLPIYSLETFLANGGKLLLSTEESGDTVEMYDIDLFIARVHSPL